MKIATVGIDLAKILFQVHAMDEHGKVALRKRLRRDQMVAFFVNLRSEQAAVSKKEDEAGQSRRSSDI